MSDPVIRRVRRSIDEARNRGGMQAGMPKVTIDAADAERLCIVAEALTAPQSAEQQPVSHDWDDQDKCRRCGDRDWYASATCTPKWQPIETAPDREYILILVDGQITGVGSTYLGDWWASMPNGEVCELNEPPTHWMPLPEAPE